MGEYTAKFAREISSVLKHLNTKEDTEIYQNIAFLLKVLIGLVLLVLMVFFFK